MLRVEGAVDGAAEGCSHSAADYRLTQTNLSAGSKSKIFMKCYFLSNINSYNLVALVMQNRHCFYNLIRYKFGHQTVAPSGG